MIDVQILDGSGTGSTAKITTRGQVVTAPLEYSLAYNATAGTANVAVNVIEPINGKRFVIDSLMLYANQGVSNTADATVDIYEATSNATATISKSLVQTNMVRQDRIILQQINLIVSEGVWVNAKTTDDDVYVTIFGYYVAA